MTIIVITIQVYKAREKKKAKKKQNVIKINNVVKDIEISSILSKTSCSFFSSAFSLIQFLKIENPLLFILKKQMNDKTLYMKNDKLDEQTN